MPKAKLTNTFVNKAKCPKDKTKKYRGQSHWGKLFLNFFFPIFLLQIPTPIKILRSLRLTKIHSL